MPEEPNRTGFSRWRAAPWLLAGAPRWLHQVIGVALVAAGLLLLVRPLTAVGVLSWYLGLSCLVSGVADLTRKPDPRPWLGAFWIAVGLAVLVWLGRDVGLLAPAVCLALIGAGVWRAATAARGGLKRGPDVVLGVAEIAFGVVGMLWHDVTLIVLAVLFGGRTAIFGVSLLLPASRASTRSQTRRDTIGRWVAAGAMAALAVGVVVLSHGLREGIAVVDSFYDVPDDLPGTPGTLLRHGVYDGDLPPGMSGFRLLYVTTDEEGTPVPASAVLAVPDDATEPAPLISWAHGTVGIAQHCAPSIGRIAISDVGMPGSDLLADHGWAMVATDYPGMGTQGAFPYLIGEGQGRAVLDAARAARQVPEVSLAEQTVIWGHSQGGHAALWAGQLADSYAPDVGVLGTAALSPAADPHRMAQGVLAAPDAMGASLAIAYVVTSYAGYYDDLDADGLLAPSARPLIREAASRCVTEGGTLVSVLAGLAVSRDQPIITSDALQGPFGDRLAQNVPLGPWEAPVFIGHGDADSVVPFAISEDFVRDRVADGADIVFTAYPGGDHLDILTTGSQLNRDLEAWTVERFE